MKEYIAPFGIGLAYPKFVPYISKFNKVIRRLTEAGLAKRWMKDIILRSKLEELSRKVVSRPMYRYNSFLFKTIYDKQLE